MTPVIRAAIREVVDQHGLRRAPARRIALAVGLALLIAGWLFFAPTAIGGRASYVVTDGSSMLPLFHGDGLVLTRQHHSYDVGEVVAYHNKDLGEIVMHRIVARDGDTYVFMGDNNDYEDHYHPTRAELVGEESLYWPGGGRLLLLVRNPLTFALIIAGTTVLSVRVPRRSRRRRRHHAR